MGFSIGQRVWRRGGQTGGIIVACEDGRVYIEQDNGVEVDYAEADVTAQPPDAARPASRPAEAAAPVRVLTPRDITPAHTKVLAIIPPRVVQAVAALHEKRHGGRFSALDVAGKLNVIAEITAVPYRMMQHYSDRPGELGLLMGKGLADSSKAR